ncbi:MAG: hypothetical protein OWU32_07390 [Firmicutes bacterium]|nr:hypothetical protein [Bacillota bacterium]
MKAIKVLVGLIYDDPWLVGGIVVALAVAKILTLSGHARFAAMIPLVVLLFGSIVLSISREVAKNRRA